MSSAALEQHAADTLEADRNRLDDRGGAAIAQPVQRSGHAGVREEKEFVGGNNSPVLTIMELDKLRVTFTLPTAVAARLKVNQSVPLTFPTSGQKARNRRVRFGP